MNRLDMVGISMFVLFVGGFGLYWLYKSLENRVYGLERQIEELRRKK